MLEIYNHRREGNGKSLQNAQRTQKAYKIAYCIFTLRDNLWSNNILILYIEIWWLKQHDLDQVYSWGDNKQDLIKHLVLVFPETIEIQRKYHKNRVWEQEVTKRHAVLTPAWYNQGREP